ncbi:MAG: nitrous oxide reductase family maturation protein NosD [Hoeflea sp.]|uniref:nitrous oxide reductase family maturation protein NosD n=1 Tax=Hoeflea sp. TaxID=1940281 RepID=UPI002731DB11|nr:nitrous oxide reductase family maturation protein NosD [Hoeflea sp.]MDP2122117.1 nitrous oxide reductase family maturation protein NosD [Hoeflea sp.]MDP3526173.1 nitrous oxide reductase family maturation protein NosD [Hoeflea sp.]
MKLTARTFTMLLGTTLLAELAHAADVRVEPGPDALVRAVELAGPGDRLILADGSYRGGFVLTRPIAIVGTGNTEVTGTGTGSVITIDAADVTIEGLKLTGSGSKHETIDSGVQMTRNATRAIVRDNHIEGNLYGVDIHGARDALVDNNTIIGRNDRLMNRRGNGVYVWNAPGARVSGNTVRLGRDGIFVNTSQKNIFTDNRFEGLRFAIHYMNADDGEVSGNISIGNHLGYAIMFSKRVTMRDNISLDDRDHGIMLNYANDAVIEGNAVVGGGEKCLFVYNANKNLIRGNRIEGCEIGIHFTGGSAKNEITGNAFVGNRTQIKFVSTRDHVWSGNYWSDHAAYDVNGDGIADQAFRPNDAMDQVLWTQPSAKLLLGSPAIQLVRWAQSEFPALLPGGIVDDRPLMKPHELPETARNWKASLQ